MASKKSGAKKGSGYSATALKGLGPGETRAALTELAEQGKPVQVIGRIRNGKLEIDQASLEEATRRFPNANWAFVAMNAPFDPTPYVSE